jgi:hypothetical protein
MTLPPMARRTTHSGGAGTDCWMPPEGLMSQAEQTDAKLRFRCEVPNPPGEWVQFASALRLYCCTP